MKEAQMLGAYILGQKSATDLLGFFAGKMSEGFEPTRDLSKIGVVNQTTMLASETQAITDYLRSCYIQLHGDANIKTYMADTRDTLCYATNDNQAATLGLLEQAADLAIVVGGYNSSNTSHLVELLEQKFPTYYIKDASEIQENGLHHFDYQHKEMKLTERFLPDHDPLQIVLTSGASCPDSIVEEVMMKILSTQYTQTELESLLSSLA